MICFETCIQCNNGEFIIASKPPHPKTHSRVYIMICLSLLSCNINGRTKREKQSERHFVRSDPMESLKIIKCVNGSRLHCIVIIRHKCQTVSASDDDPRDNVRDDGGCICTPGAVTMINEWTNGVRRPNVTRRPIIRDGRTNRQSTNALPTDRPHPTGPVRCNPSTDGDKACQGGATMIPLSPASVSP